MEKDKKSNKKFNSPLDNAKQARLKAAIKAAGLTQAEVARQVGIDPKYLSMFITGNRQITKKTMIDIAKVLDCEIEYLLCEQDYKNFDDLHQQWCCEEKEKKENEEKRFCQFLADYMNIKSISPFSSNQPPFENGGFRGYELIDNETDKNGQELKYYLTNKQLDILRKQIFSFAEVQKKILVSPCDLKSFEFMHEIHAIMKGHSYSDKSKNDNT